MAEITIYLGNKNYSSWSLRPWLSLKQTGVAFDEEVIPLNELTLWDGLAICEYLAETFPEAKLWPADKAARAVARSVCAEMHSGFAALREHLPMNMRSSFPNRGVTPE